MPEAQLSGDVRMAVTVENAEKATDYLRGVLVGRSVRLITAPGMNGVHSSFEEWPQISEVEYECSAAGIATIIITAPSRGTILRTGGAMKLVHELSFTKVGDTLVFTASMNGELTVLIFAL